MPESLTELERRRGELLRELSRLQDLRPGSISGIVRRCGKPTCHCAQPDDPGHGPTLRMTYKLDGKTVSEACPRQPQSARPSAKSTSSENMSS
jgi:Family of unknown function (DUF6788)